MSAEKVREMKMHYLVYFDCLRKIPPALQKQQFKLVLTRGDKVVQTDPFGLPPGVHGESCDIRTVRSFECNLKPSSTQIGYKPCTLRVQVVTLGSRIPLVDAIVNLEKNVKGEVAPLVKMNVTGLEPPMSLLMAVEGISDKESKRRQAEALQKRKEDEAAAAAAPGPAAQPAATAPPADAGALDDDAEIEPTEAILVGHAVERDDHAAVVRSSMGGGGDGGALDADEAFYRISGMPASVDIGSRGEGQLAAEMPPAEHEGADAPSASEHGTAGTDRYAAAASNAARDLARQQRAKRREERQSRAVLARLERARRVESASLQMQSEISSLLDTARKTVMTQANIEVDGVRATAPRAVQRIISAIDEYTREFAADSLPDYDQYTLDDQIPVPIVTLDEDSDGETDELEAARLQRQELRPVLPPEAPLLLLVHDLVVMIRWDLSPTPHDHHELGAWMHTLLLLFNHVLQCMTAEESAALLPMLQNYRLNPDAVGKGSAVLDPAEIVRDALHTAAGDVKAAKSAQKRSRRWWRSVRRPRIFGGSKKKRPADVGLEEESPLPGVRTILSQVIKQQQESYGTERSMGCATSTLPLFHSIGARLDAMWSSYEERLVGSKQPQPQQKGGKGGAAAAASAPESEQLSAYEAFPMLTALPANVYSEGEQPAVTRRAAQSPLWDLLRSLVTESMPSDPDAPRGPFSAGESPMNEAVKNIGAVLALELDMALHELLLQCVHMHIDSLPDFAFPAMAPYTEEEKPDAPPLTPYASPERSHSRWIEEAKEQAAAAEEAAQTGSPAGSMPAFRWLMSALSSLGEELIASDIGDPQGITRGYIWNNPLSVQLASNVMRLTLEQLCVLVLNENHRRLAKNLVPFKPPKKAKGPHPLFEFKPVTEDGCNVDGERVLASVADGLHLKSRLDAIEAWLDNLPVQLGQGCRAALLPLRSMCDLLILQPDVLMDDDVRTAALGPLPAAVQRALFAAIVPVPWEHEDDLELMQESREFLYTEALRPQVPDEIATSKNAQIPAKFEPSATALPFAIAYRSAERDFSFFDMLMLPSPFYGSVDATDRALREFDSIVTQRAAVAKQSKALKALPPVPAGHFATTDLMPTQAIDGLVGHESTLMQNTAHLRGLAVTARWDTQDYRESIGLSATDEMRREEQLLDARRGPDAYVAPDTVLERVKQEWDLLGDQHNRQQHERMTVAAALIGRRKTGPKA